MNAQVPPSEHDPNPDWVREQKDQIRLAIWEVLRHVARPDSRFHWDFGSFIADYEGSEEGARRIQALPAWNLASLLFITPDNNLEPLRRLALADGKPFVMSTYGLARGFLYLDPATLPETEHGWAATLDGMDRFARPLGLREVSALGGFDLLVTGASAIGTNGIRFGKGHGYFDLEWAMFSEVGAVAPGARVIGAGHDCQVVDVALPAAPFDVLVDLIVTPTRTLPASPAPRREAGRILWDRLEPDMEDRIPPLRELRAMHGA